MNALTKFAMVTLIVALMSPGVVAQVTAPGVTGQPESEQYTAEHETPKTEHQVLKASDLIGMEVKNNANEDLGSIEDLVIDRQTGKIEYAAISVGGFAGVGDKLFAVPFQAMRCEIREGAVTGRDMTVAVLDVDRETLENSEGFDQNNWPAMANDQWKQDSDRPVQAQRPDQQSTENR